MKKLLSKLLLQLFLVSVNLNFPRGAGFILPFLTKKINKKGEHTILCLGRSIFLDDILALTQYSKQHKYIYFHKGLLGKVVKKFLPFAHLAEHNYYTEEKFKQGRENTRNFMRKMFPVLRSVLQFDAIMSGNIGYLDQQEFFVAARENNIPVIVLYKEGVAPKQHLNEFFASLYENHVFHGELLLCYNNNIREALIEAGINGLSQKKIITTGIPRLDSYIHEKISYDKQIVLFSFYPLDKFAYFIKSDEKLEPLNRISELFHYMVMKFAHEHTDWKVVIKTKVADRYINYVNDIYAKYFQDTKTDNLVITNNACSKSLILESKVILGYNSTVLIESILAGKNIITPDFQNILKGTVAWDYFSNYPELVNCAATYEQLIAIIKENISIDESKERNAFLTDYIYSYDGQSSRRVEKAISNLLN